MIPGDYEEMNEELEFEPLGSKDYKLLRLDNRINGTTDEIEAMGQVIYKILNTERYEHLIYSWDYGIELDDLFGEPISYVCPELQRRIIEALTADDRIEFIDTFEFDTSKKRVVTVSFIVHTIFGEIGTEKAVDY